MGQAGDEGRMLFWMEKRERMFAKGEDSGGGGSVGGGTAQNHPLVAKMEAIEEAEGEVADSGPGEGGGE